jgi:hypothetical protein
MGSIRGHGPAPGPGRVSRRTRAMRAARNRAAGGPESAAPLLQIRSWSPSVTIRGGQEACLHQCFRYEAVSHRGRGGMTMDATRTRRTRDRMGRPSTRAIGRGASRGSWGSPLREHLPRADPIAGPADPHPPSRDLSSRNRSGRRSRGADSPDPRSLRQGTRGRARPQAVSVLSSAVSSARRASTPDPLRAPGPDQTASTGLIHADPSCRGRREPRSLR